MIGALTDHRNINIGDLVVLTYDYDYDTREIRTIGVITEKIEDVFGAELYRIYWFQRGIMGDHYWFHVIPVTLEEYEKGLYYDYYQTSTRHSER